MITFKNATTTKMLIYSSIILFDALVSCCNATRILELTDDQIKSQHVVLGNVYNHVEDFINNHSSALDILDEELFFPNPSPVITPGVQKAFQQIISNKNDPIIANYSDKSHRTRPIFNLTHDLEKIQKILANIKNGEQLSDLSTEQLLYFTEHVKMIRKIAIILYKTS